MLSYRHAFHAGNHADVLKHLILFLVLRYFNRKDKAYWYIDTHAGAGAYRLDDDRAQKTGEYRDGIARLWAASALPPVLDDFCRQTEIARPDENSYAGSPLLAASMLRPSDKIRLFERHPADFPVLRQTMAAYRRQCIIGREDGFGGLIALLPPPTRRAVILIDPSYETAEDYRLTTLCLQGSLKRFATGCYLIWYPLLDKPESARLPERLTRLCPSWLSAELTIGESNADGFGMKGSGVAVLNPPWLLREELRFALPRLVDLLRQSPRATYSLRHHE